jgi:hypothetical protein
MGVNPWLKLIENITVAILKFPFILAQPPYKNYPAYELSL